MKSYRDNNSNENYLKENCKYCVCNELHEEIKSLQKSEARSRRDIRNIIREELVSFFKKAIVK
jgi:hypothetical protein